MSVPWHLLLCYGLLVGLGFATHDVATLSPVSSWYPRRRGLVTGIVKTGSACGQVLVPLLVAWLVVTLGWRNAFATLGVLAAIALVLLAQFMQRKPVAALPDHFEIKGVKGQAAELGLSFKQATRDRKLWTFCAIQFCFIILSLMLRILA